MGIAEGALGGAATGAAAGPYGAAAGAAIGALSGAFGGGEGACANPSGICLNRPADLGGQYSCSQSHDLQNVADIKAGSMASGSYLIRIIGYVGNGMDFGEFNGKPITGAPYPRSKYPNPTEMQRRMNLLWYVKRANSQGTDVSVAEPCPNYATAADEAIKAFGAQAAATPSQQRDILEAADIRDAALARRDASFSRAGLGADLAFLKDIPTWVWIVLAIFAALNGHSILKALAKS